MQTHRLSKSAFKLGRSCPTKLFYARSGYVSTLADNSYLTFLADGGYMVGALSHVIYPDGTLIEGGSDQELALRLTAEELKKEIVTLFEAALQAGNKLVRIDILEKRGKSIRLIEVKSKGFDSEEEDEYNSNGKRTTFRKQNGDFDPEWRPYLEDICYQAYVASLAYPEFEFIPFLLLPDKALTTSVDGLGSMFAIDRTPSQSGRGNHLTVTFLGDDQIKNAIRAGHFMKLINVETEVAKLWDEVRAAADELDKSLTPELKKIEVPPGRHCKDCEYRVNGPHKSGFRECWGQHADADPHIFDLYYGTQIDGGRLYDTLIAQGQTSLFHVPTALLSGERGKRQLIQINGSKDRKEWFSDELPEKMRGVTYPLYFIDFETSRLAIPYHAGMSPYEQIAFQWSCHTVEAPGAPPRHTEWINVDHAFPNIEFASSLREQIGDTGTVLTWAHHESSVLSDIARQIKKYRRQDDGLAGWLSDVCDRERGRILDLNKETLKSYFHPDMRGKTSLKAVLPAIWNSYPELYDVPWFKPYVQYDVCGVKVLDPYKTLPTLEIAGQAEAIREGTGAMRAYQHMLYGTGRSASTETKEQWKRLLLQYCELDTLAMLVVWTYWERRLGLR
jgi:hypothetical protein